MDNDKPKVVLNHGDGLAVANGLNILRAIAYSPLSKEAFFKILTEVIKRADISDEKLLYDIKAADEYIDQFNEQIEAAGVKPEKLEIRYDKSKPK